MASHQPPTTSIWTKPGILLKSGIWPIRAIFSFAVCLLPNTLLHGWPIKRTLFSSVAYSQVKWLTFEESRYGSQTTGDQIASYCKGAGLSHHTETLESEGNTPNATLHYIDRKPETNRKVLFWFHGGGFGNPILGPGHPPFLVEIARAAKADDIVILEYTLAPELKYPGQLRQYISAVRHLLKSHKASEIIVGGDSAGGNATLALLAHTIKPSLYAEPLDLEGDKFRGALLVSPWVTFRLTGPSYKTNAWNDFLTPALLQQFADAYAPKHGEIYAEPMEASPDFWKALPVSRTLVTSGTWEVFDSDIRATAQNMGAKQFDDTAPVQLALAEKETHIQCIVDFIMGIDPSQGIMMQECLEWSRTLA